MPEKKDITEEMKVHEQWFTEAREMTMDELPAFLNRLMDDYGHDYGTVIHALTAGAVATCWAMNKHEQGGITGFQAGCLMWEFIRRWNKESNKCGLRLVDYDDFLYPQYEDRFNTTISPETWEAIQKEAQGKLDENSSANMAVIEHWESIVAGIVPFGYSIKPD